MDWSRIYDQIRNAKFEYILNTDPALAFFSTPAASTSRMYDIAPGSLYLLNTDYKYGTHSLIHISYFMLNTARG